MASWGTDVSGAKGISTIGEISNYKSERSGHRAEAADISYAKTGGWLGKDYSVVGINANQVGTMREAIRNYVTGIQTEISKIQTDLDANGAFKGEEVQSAVRAYLTTVEDYAKALTSYLLTFSDKLKDVEEAWTSYVGTMAGNVTNTKGTFGSTQTYTEKKN